MFLNFLCILTKNIETNIEKVSLICNNTHIVDFYCVLNHKIPIGKLIYSEIKLTGGVDTDLFNVKICFSHYFNVREPEKDILIHVSDDKYKLIRFMNGSIHVKDVRK